METKDVIMLIVSIVAAGAMVYIHLRFMRKLRRLEEERWGPRK